MERKNENNNLARAAEGKEIMYPNAPIEFTEEHQAEIDQWQAKYEEVKGMLLRVMGDLQCAIDFNPDTRTEIDVDPDILEWWKKEKKNEGV